MEQADVAANVRLKMMKIYLRILLLFTLSGSLGFASNEPPELKDYVLPLPARFVEFADDILEQHGSDISESFKMFGIMMPAGAKIEIDRASESLNVRLEREQALNVIELINHSIVHTPARFFRGDVIAPSPARAEKDAEAQFPIPQDHAAQAGLAIHVEKREGDKLTCLFVNNSDRPIQFISDGVSSPVYRFQSFTADKWTRHVVIKDCEAGGVIYSVLPPKRACRFTVELPKTDLPLRVGVSLIDEVSIQLLANTIWSESIPPAQ